ncbi:hypothetical protein CBS147323_2886 [Aspergillus niger]|nr:hypothetical protein CBS147323_2886 [Aspergillus niger]KAI3014385.1 hypothetical protein CBS147345_5368 [Aspergillus niger]KAI3023741.1 hypothetical protein CBS147347_6548 [Aspergillus niger]KAI3075454.1 hypothetical protein CBS147353_5178 [Aspergillus niger]SPB45292.1 unnamed protein product [Aspergillus niger]
MSRSLGMFALSAGMVHINVGADETPFDVHVELLCSCSPYFDSIYGDRTKNPIPSDPVCFPDEDPVVFAELLAWMYYGDIPIDLPSRTSIHFLLQLWILAGTFEIARLQNQVIHLCRTEIAKVPGRTFSSDDIDFVYSHTLPQSPLRLLLVDNWARNATQEHFTSCQKNLPYPFLEELCRAFIERKGNVNNAEGEIHSVERYNIHPPPPEDQNDRLMPRERVSEFPRTAPPEKLRNRKIARPSPRLNKASLTSPLRAMTPNSVEENDPKSEVSSQMSHLQI